ncbi:MAG TPA: hypothetical protein VML94_00645 [Thermoplasmata archaeon]|nr:hypothetical protein [Thermoplasmata archaeon]
MPLTREIGPAVGSSAVTTLDALNNTLLPGYQSPWQQEYAASVAFDPVLDRLFVAGYYPSTPMGAFLSVVDPTTNGVVGALNVSSCGATPGVASLQYDPNDNLLFHVCENGTLQGLDPVTGAVNVSMTLPDVITGPDCAGLEPIPAALGAGFVDHELFALVYGCRSTNASVTNLLVLDVFNDESNTFVSTVPVVSTEGIGQLGFGEPLAFDAASDQVYVVLGPNLNPFDWNVAVIDPGLGSLDGEIAVPFLTSASVGIPIAYDPGLGAVIAAGERFDPASGQGVLVASLLRLDFPANRTVALLNWTARSHAAAPGAPYYDPAWLTPFPGPGTDVIVSMEQEGLGGRTLVENLTSRAEVGNFSTARTGPGAYDPENGVAYLTEGSASALQGIEEAPVRLLAGIPVGVAILGAAVDPTTGTVFAVEGSYCGTAVDSGSVGAYGCPNETMVAIQLPSDHVERSWSLPPGVTQSVAFDSLNGEVYDLSLCGTWSGEGPNRCGGLNSTSLLSAYSRSGQPVGSQPLPLPDEPQSIQAWGLSVDTTTGAILVFATASARGLLLLEVDPSSLAVLSSIPISSTSAVGSVLYVPPGLAFVTVNEFIETPPSGLEAAVDVVDLADGEVVATTLLQAGQAYGNDRLAYDPTAGMVFASVDSTVYALNASTGAVLSDFNVTGGAESLAFDSQSGLLYTVGDNVSELTTAGTVIASYQVANPFYLAGELVVDPVSGTAVATQYQGGTIAFVRGPGTPRHSIDFPETGLPTDTPWAVTLDGQTETGPGTLSFGLPNGTYAYSMAPVAGYHRTGVAPNGNVTVAGADVLESPAVFAQAAYSVVFDMGGATGSAGWKVTIGEISGLPFPGPCTGCVNTTTEQSFLASNGTYRYVVQSLTSGYRVVGAPATGVYVVSGEPVTLSFDLAVGSTPSIVFHQTGLPLATEWCVGLAAPSVTCSSSRTIRFSDLTPGVYTYSISPIAGYSVHHRTGLVTLGGRVVSLNRTFAPTRYAITFTETGLKRPTEWRIDIDGKVLSGTGHRHTVHVPNGTYPYTIRAVNGYAVVSSGSVTIDGTGVPVYPQFFPHEFAVTFSEAGLPSGTEWTVRIGNQTIASNTSTLEFLEPNGTYQYHIGGEYGYRHSGTPTTLRVRGAPSSVQISFRPALGAAPSAGASAPSTIARVRSGSLGRTTR